MILGLRVLIEQHVVPSPGKESHGAQVRLSALASRPAISSPSNITIFIRASATNTVMKIGLWRRVRAGFKKHGKTPGTPGMASS